jgi:hypothetical protein
MGLQKPHFGRAADSEEGETTERSQALGAGQAVPMNTVSRPTTK